MKNLKSFESFIIPKPMRGAFWSGEKLGLAVLKRLENINVNDKEAMAELNLTKEIGMVRAYNFYLGLKFRFLTNSPFGDSLSEGGREVKISDELCKKIKEQLIRLS